MLLVEQSLPNMCLVGKSINILYLLKETLNYAIDKGKFDCAPDKLQLATDVGFILSNEIIEYEDWMEACAEFLEAQKLRRNTND